MKKEKKSLIYRFAAAYVTKLFRLIFRCKVLGRENIPKEGAILFSSSHVSVYDPIFIGDLCQKRKVRYMAKDSLFKKKLISKLLYSLGAFPVVRGSGGEDALGEAKSILHDEGVLCVFIEGTRSKDGNLQRPKTGVPLLAFETSVNIIPISVIGQGGNLPRKFKKTCVSIGKPITIEEAGITDSSSMHYRRGAKYIMGKISELREEAIKYMEN